MSFTIGRVRISGLSKMCSFPKHTTERETTFHKQVEVIDIVKPTLSQVLVEYQMLLVSAE